MNDVVKSKNGKTWYLTRRDARELELNGCPRGHGPLVERTHPQYGGKFMGCERPGCQNVSVSWVPYLKRRNDIQETHEYRANGFE